MQAFPKGFFIFGLFVHKAVLGEVFQIAKLFLREFDDGRDSFVGVDDNCHVCLTGVLDGVGLFSPCPGSLTEALYRERIYRLIPCILVFK